MVSTIKIVRILVVVGMTMLIFDIDMIDGRRNTNRSRRRQRIKDREIKELQEEHSGHITPCPTKSETMTIEGHDDKKPHQENHNSPTHGSIRGNTDTDDHHHAKTSIPDDKHLNPDQVKDSIGHPWSKMGLHEGKPRRPSLSESQFPSLPGGKHQDKHSNQEKLVETNPRRSEHNRHKENDIPHSSNGKKTKLSSPTMDVWSIFDGHKSNDSDHKVSSRKSEADHSSYPPSPSSPCFKHGRYYYDSKESATESTSSSTFGKPVKPTHHKLESFETVEDPWETLKHHDTPIPMPTPMNSYRSNMGGFNNNGGSDGFGYLGKAPDFDHEKHTTHTTYEYDGKGRVTKQTEQKTVDVNGVEKFKHYIEKHHIYAKK